MIFIKGHGIKLNIVVLELANELERRQKKKLIIYTDFTNLVLDTAIQVHYIATTYLR